MENERTKHVEALLKKAAETDNAGAAMNFSQAACNAANAIRVVLEIERATKPARSEA